MTRSVSGAAVKVSLTRIILYVQDVARLTAFYRNAFGLSVVQEITDEWVVLQAGYCELALHRAGEAFRNADVRSAGANNNAKIVFAVHGDLVALRTTLLKMSLVMGEIRSYAGVIGPHCDGTDPEGNVFQIVQA